MIGICRRKIEKVYKEAYNKGKEAGFKEGRERGYIDGLRDSGEKAVIINSSGLVFIQPDEKMILKN